MPEWRKLHVKTKDSDDVNDMPDDFARLLWMMLSITLDREGRGIYKASWIKSHAFPIREDAACSHEHIMESMEWFRGREMVRVYMVNGRLYFDIPTWHDYQNTTREAPSTLPSFEEGTQELLMSNSRPCHAPEKEKEKEKDTEKEKESAPKKTSAQRPQADLRSKKQAIQIFKEIVRRYPKIELFDEVIGALGEEPNKARAEACYKEWLKRGYNANSIEWLEWYKAGAVPPRKMNGNGATKKRTLTGANGETIEVDE